jgi:transglutaminase-like putative cysteine protease
MKRLRDAIIFAHVGLAVAALSLGGGGSPWGLSIFCLVCAWAFRSQPRLEKGAWWTIGVASALALSIARAIREGEVLDAAIDFLLVLLVQRLINRASVRAQYQLILLSAIALIIAAVVNAGISLPFLILLYLPAMSLALIATNLKSQAERLGLQTVAQQDTDLRLHVRPIARASVLVALWCVLSGVFVFFAFPRFGMGWFIRGAVASQPTAGFSEQVELGHFGTIRDDQAIVMRIFPQEKMVQDRLDIHWRGAAYDAYQHGRWSHSQAAIRTPIAPRRGYFTYPQGLEISRPAATTKTPRNSAIWPEHDFRARIVLEDIGTELIFVPSSPVAVNLSGRQPLGSRARLFGATDHEWMILGRLPGSVAYEAAARLREPSAEEARATSSVLNDSKMDPYLRVPAEVQAEINPLVQALTAGKEHPYDRALALMAHLATFRYTTTAQPSQRLAKGDDPVLAFLFETKAGHCEYFASALTLLLREAKIPARHVTGFSGATYNEVGDFYVVRQSDAHSWVEAYFGELGWVMLDPTPSDGRPNGMTAGLNWLRTYVDALEQEYLEWVVDFDLSKQRQLFGRGASAPSSNPTQAEASSAKSRWSGEIGGVAAFFAIAYLGQIWRRRHRPARRLARLGQDLARFLVKLGAPLNSSSTLTKLARQIPNLELDHRRAIEDIIAAYESLRFRREPVHTREVMEVKRRFESLAARNLDGHSTRKKKK